MYLGGYGLVSWKATMKEMKTGRFYKDVLCEGFTTFIFMTFVTQSAMAFHDDAGATVFSGSLAGFGVLALVDSYAHIAPTLFNPSLVLVLVTSCRMSIPKGILFIAVEMVMSVAATSMIYEFTPDDVLNRTNFSPPGPSAGISEGYCWVCEFIAVIFFASVVLGAIDDKRRSVVAPHLAIGLCVTAAGTLGHPYGVSLNPIVSFGFSYVTNDYSLSWIYWTAGPAAGIVATMIYYFFAYEEGTCAKTNMTEDDDETEVSNLDLTKGGGEYVNGAFVNDTVAIKTVDSVTQSF